MSTRAVDVDAPDSGLSATVAAVAVAVTVAGVDEDALDTGFPCESDGEGSGSGLMDGDLDVAGDRTESEKSQRISEFEREQGAGSVAYPWRSSPWVCPLRLPSSRPRGTPSLQASSRSSSGLHPRRRRRGRRRRPVRCRRLRRRSRPDSGRDSYPRTAIDHLRCPCVACPREPSSLWATTRATRPRVRRTASETHLGPCDGGLACSATQTESQPRGSSLSCDPTRRPRRSKLIGSMGRRNQRDPHAGWMPRTTRRASRGERSGPKVGRTRTCQT